MLTELIIFSIKFRLSLKQKTVGLGTSQTPHHFHNTYIPDILFRLLKELVDLVLVLLYSFVTLHRIIVKHESLLMRN
jgi:hypothetical protein